MASAARIPYGQKYYWPIYRAAVEHNLPVAIHVGAEGTAKPVNVLDEVRLSGPTPYVDFPFTPLAGSGVTSDQVAAAEHFRDFLLTPAVSVPAFAADEARPPNWAPGGGVLASWTPFSYPFNWSGNPAVSIPCGFTLEGLPVGLQIVARRFDDLGVLQASAAFEAARPWVQHRPVIGA